MAWKCFSDKTDFQVGAKDFQLQVVCWSKGGERDRREVLAPWMWRILHWKDKSCVRFWILETFASRAGFTCCLCKKKCSINNLILFSWNTTCPLFSCFRVERQLQKWIRRTKCFTMTLWECFLSRARVSRDISWLHFAHWPVQLVKFSNLQVWLGATVKKGLEALQSPVNPWL